MRRAWEIARRTGRGLTAVLLLVLCLPVPLANLLQASAAASPEVCQCCRRKGHHDCRKTAGSSSEPSWSASPMCEYGCSHPGSLTSSGPLFAREGAGPAAQLPQIAVSLAALSSLRRAIYHSAWRFQRPPPLT